MAQNVYDDPYDQALADPRFLAAATAAHAGRWSLLDALWWEWHPEDPAPSGSPSPIHRLRELQRRVFAADGDAAGDHAVAQVVRELEAEIVAERAAATKAITAAHADLRRRTAGLPHDVPAYPTAPAVPSIAPAVDGSPEPTMRNRSRVKKVLIPVVGSVAVLGILGLKYNIANHRESNLWPVLLVAVIVLTLIYFGREMRR
ncbi:hypothetical protein E3O42_16575 [Cryobacterium adonitolivorans]|uniref:Uncharacterized protein n=1 Tax=Cryobacterium adonitolivorans TaxID=1259189 RepID=A0A4R8W0M2_9MICO|nr:hypothetical protein [Cryobacterium adonitolivorans]TFB96757.1 hypothetical protein E3O42_16575 [Cryobacterium adonitolivorans]